jgi:hypothetical protein
MLTEVKNPNLVEKEKTPHTDQERLNGTDNFTVTSLCGTCKFQRECVLTMDKEKVMECEQFALQEEDAPTRSTFTENESKITIGNNRFPREDEFIGLCRTCNHRFDCIYLEGSSGVWNCEMYE